MNRETRQYESLQVSELFCPRCKRAQPVRRHLLLVLPSGNRYDYRCATCATSVGAETDNDASAFAEATPGLLRSGRR